MYESSIFLAHWMRLPKLNALPLPLCFFKQHSAYVMRVYFHIWIGKGKHGATLADITEHSHINEYAASVLLDMGLSGRIITCKRGNVLPGENRSLPPA